MHSNITNVGYRIKRFQETKQALCLYTSFNCHARLYIIFRTQSFHIRNIGEKKCFLIFLLNKVRKFCRRLWTSSTTNRRFYIIPQSLCRVFIGPSQHSL